MKTELDPNGRAFRYLRRIDLIRRRFGGEPQLIATVAGRFIADAHRYRTIRDALSALVREIRREERSETT